MSTTKYIMLNFPRLLLGLAPLTVAAVFLLHPVNTFVYGTRFAPSGLTGFPALFFWLNRQEIGSAWYMHIAFAVVHLLTCCYLTAIVEKDFKVGRLSVRSPLYNINNTFPPIFKAYFLLSVGLFLFKLLLTCLFALLVYILTAAGAMQLYADITVAIAAALLFMFFILLARTVLLAVVTMLIYGYTFRESLGITIKFGDKKQARGVTVGVFLPVIIQFAVCYIMVALAAPAIVYRIVDSALITLLTVYTCVFALTAVYDISGVERRDKITKRNAARKSGGAYDL